MTDTPGIPERPSAGWYLDPDGRMVPRWWDGAYWTEATRALSRKQSIPVRSCHSSYSDSCEWMRLIQSRRTTPIPR